MGQVKQSNVWFPYRNQLCTSLCAVLRHCPSPWLGSGISALGNPGVEYEVAILRRIRLAGSSEDCRFCLTSSTRFSYLNREIDGQPASLFATWHKALVSVVIRDCAPSDLGQTVCVEMGVSRMSNFQSLLLSSDRSSSHAVDILYCITLIDQASSFATGVDLTPPQIESSGNYDVFAMAHPTFRPTDQTHRWIVMLKLFRTTSRYIQPAFCRYLPNASKVQSGSRSLRPARHFRAIPTGFLLGHSTEGPLPLLISAL
jgi:hypothetical protein